MRVRPVRPEDASAWLALREALWPDERGSLAREVARFFESPVAGLDAVLIAESDAAVVGFIELSVRPWAEGCRSSPVGYVEGWYVAPEGRRRGVGRRLVQAAEDWARGRGLVELASDTEADNAVGQRAHLGSGFSDEGTIRCFAKRL